jgi:hypothetical protein
MFLIAIDVFEFVPNELWFKGFSVTLMKVLKTGFNNNLMALGLFVFMKLSLTNVNLYDLSLTFLKLSITSCNLDNTF